MTMADGTGRVRPETIPGRDGTDAVSGVPDEKKTNGHYGFLDHMDPDGYDMLEHIPERNALEQEEISAREKEEAEAARPGGDRPKTVAELQEYCFLRGMPLEKMRFFIDTDFREPKAFGLYRAGEQFVVYMNRADGSRLIRYHGPNEAYAVNQLYQKLLSECHKRNIYPENFGMPGGMRRLGLSGSGMYTGKPVYRSRTTGMREIPVIIKVILVFVAVIMLFLAVMSAGINAAGRSSGSGRGSYRSSPSYYDSRDWYRDSRNDRWNDSWNDDFDDWDPGDTDWDDW